MKTLKHNPRVTSSPITKEAFCEFYGMSSTPFSLRGISFYLDGKLAGVGGIRYCNGFFLAFSEMKPDIMASKATIFRCALEIMEIIKGVGMPVYAVCGNALTAPRLLRKLGFIFSHTDDEGEVYRWAL